MNTEKPKIYRLDDKISFRECDGLHCTNSCDDVADNGFVYEKNKCLEKGVHLHCSIHPQIELLPYGPYLECRECKTRFRTEKDALIKQSKAILNEDYFKGAKLVRVDDFYIPEVKKNLTADSDYFIDTSVKTDKDGDTIVQLLIGNKNDSEKSQFFIKPEKLQLSSDHKDLDPAKILSKIEVVLKNRVLKQDYDS